MIDLFARAGSPREFEGHHAMFIEGAGRCWCVAAGEVDLFSAQSEGDQVTGPRSHLATLEKGDVLFGMDFSPHSGSRKILAVGRKGGRICEAPREQIVSEVMQSGRLEDFANSLDQWLSKVGEGIAKTVAMRQKGEAALFPGQPERLAAGQAFSAKREICWIQAPTSELLFLGATDILFKSDSQWFPLIPFVWLESYEERDVLPERTIEVVGKGVGEVLSGLDGFHSVFMETIDLFAGLTALDESNRLHSKGEYQKAARVRAAVSLASVLTPGLDEFADDATDTNAIYNAMQMVAKHVGFEIQPIAEMPETPGFKVPLMIAKASGVRSRKVALRGAWWKKDVPAFFAYREIDKSPVAVIPLTPRAKILIDGKTGKREKLVEANAIDLHPFGISFYRSLPPGKLGARDLLKFAFRSLGSEVFWIIGLGIILGLTGIVSPLFMGYMLDAVIPGADRQELAQMIGGLVAIAFATIAFQMARGIAFSRMETKIEYSLQSALWSRLIALPMSFFKNHSSGDLAARAYGISVIRDLISGVGVTVILGAFTGLFNLIVLFTRSVQFAVVGVALVAVAVVFSLLLGLWQRSHARHLYALDGELDSLVYQMISGVSKIRVSGAEDHALMLWASKFSQMRKHGVTMGKIGNVMSVYQAAYPTLCSMVLYWTLVQLQGGPSGSNFSTGAFIAFNAAFGSLLASMLGLCGASVELFQIKQVFDRLRPILDQPVEEKGTFPGTLSGDIRLSHVNFRYVENGPLILKEISLHIKEGEFVALAGPSGSGKSTILRLLLGFEKAESGKIYYDDLDLDSLQLSEVREQIGAVLQTSQLVPTDVFRNIVGQSDATMDDAWEAASAAGLGEDIQGMPMQMYTVVSEGSGGFSGGQKQRLMIARALVKKPRIIFLDEATSALDNRTQKAVTDNMNRMQATRVVVAHRMSTIRHADRIIVLVDGRVVEEGTFDELVEKGGVFTDLARGQLEEEEKEKEKEKEGEGEVVVEQG